jgi:hypothetical protein
MISTAPGPMASSYIKNYFSFSIQLELGHQTRDKVAHEARKVDPDLRKMVALCNTLDNYMLQRQLQQRMSQILEDASYEGDVFESKGLEAYSNEGVPLYRNGGYCNYQLKVVEIDSGSDSDSDSGSDSDSDSDGNWEEDNHFEGENESLRKGDSLRKQGREATLSVTSKPQSQRTSNWEVNRTIHTFLNSMLSLDVRRCENQGM